MIHPARSRFLALAILIAAASAASAQDAGDDAVAEWMARADSVHAALAPRTRADSLQFASRTDVLAGAALAQQTYVGMIAAESLLARSLAVRERVAPPDSTGVMACLDNLASVAFNRGEAARALPYRERACSLGERLLGPDDPRLAMQRGNLGANLVEVGQPARALPLLEAARAVLQDAPPEHHVDLVAVLTSLGELLRIQNRYAEAESCLTLAITRARLNAPDHLPMAINNLAGVYKDQGGFEAAVPLLHESLQLRKNDAQPDPGLLATATLNLAEMDRLRGRIPEAASQYAEALRFARLAVPPESPDLAWFLNQAAVHHRMMEQLDEADRASREAIEILRQSGTESLLLAQVLVDRADLLRELGHPAAGDSCARAAIDVRTRLLGADHPDVAVAVVAHARCVAAGAGNVADATQALDRAVAVLDATVSFPEARMDARALRAELRAATGDRSGAIADMTQALATMETLRPNRGDADARADLVRRTAHYTEQIVGWCLAQGDVARAFEFVERGRARVFLDQLAAANVDPGAGAPTEARQTAEARVHAARLQLDGRQRQIATLQAQLDVPRREHIEQLAALERERDAAAVELQRALEGVFRASPQWRETVTASGQPIGLDAVARTLVPRDGMVMVYAVGEQQSWLFAMSSTSPQIQHWALRVDPTDARQLGTEPGPLRRDALAEAVAKLELDRRGPSRTRGVALQSTQPGADGTAARRALWRTLVPEPLRQRLLAANEVVVVPDVALHSLPFEALVVSDPDRAVYTWLDAGPVVRYAPSATSLAEIERAARTQRAAATGPDAVPVLCVANPEFAIAGGVNLLAGLDVAPLPGTGDEAEAVRVAFGAGRVTVLAGSEATEARVRAALGGRRIVHFATHGIADRSRDALLAGLVLAPGAPPPRAEDDGFLQLFEIYGSRTDCDLAVLSACATSSGAEVQGEGVLALSRGFLAAGARQVVASLWDVDDAATAALMQTFFQHLAAAARSGDPLHAAVALRDAKREVAARSGWQDPFYWAAFVAAGASATATPHASGR